MKRLLVLLCSLAVFGLSSSAMAKELVLGTMAPLTGDNAADGNDIKNGVMAAVDAFTAENPDYTVTLKAEDDACDPRQCVSVANKLIGAKVFGVVGSYCSGCTIPSSEVLADANIPMVTPASTNPKVTERGMPMMYRICGRDDQQGPAAVKFAKEMLKAKTIVIVDDKTTYSQGLADVVEKEAKAQGLNVLLHDHVNQGDKDFSAVLTKIKAANPDVFYMSLQSNAPSADMLVQARRAGVTAKVISQDAGFHPMLIQNAKEAAEGCFLTFGFADKATSGYKKFEKFYAKYGKPGSYSTYAYDAAMSLLLAAKAAGSTSPDKVKAAMAKLDFEGASKKIKFDAKGDTGSDYIIYEVKGGQFVPYWDPATGKSF